MRAARDGRPMQTSLLGIIRRDARVVIAHIALHCLKRAHGLACRSRIRATDSESWGRACTSGAA